MSGTHKAGDIVTNKAKPPAETLPPGLIWRKARGQTGKWQAVVKPVAGAKGKAKARKAKMPDVATLADESLTALADAVAAEVAARKAKAEALAKARKGLTEALAKVGVDLATARALLAE